jgi:hypothetical protein
MPELPSPAIWRFVRASLRLEMAWAEDRAMLGSNPSADSGAEMGRGRVRFCPCCPLAEAIPYQSELILVHRLNWLFRS